MCLLLGTWYYVLTLDVIDQFYEYSPDPGYIVRALLNSHGLERLFLFRFGAAMAAGIFTLFSDNPVVLSVFGFFFSLPCFYYIVATPEYAASGRFILLTYNLTCLF